MKINKQRKSIRLANYDYSSVGAYFLTICTYKRKCIFGSVGVGRDRPDYMKLNKFGKIIESVLKSLPNHHPVELDTIQIMPNHVHFVIVMVGCNHQIDLGGSRPAPTTSVARPAPTLGNIIGLFKSECTKNIRCFVNDPALNIWQRNYYEHVIRNETDLNEIREYIQTNPQNWGRDRNNPNLIQ